MASTEEMRLDKGLWAARFYKTRALAQKNIELGRVKLNGREPKRSAGVRAGDVLELRINALPYEITVAGLNPQRRGAAEARALYVETPESAARREAARLAIKASRIETDYKFGKPTKKDRREIEAFKNTWR